tara:strand:- start:84 stop:215 length:132 start_codon:yes stop_codon:yes gene_type:complete
MEGVYNNPAAFFQKSSSFRGGKLRLQELGPGKVHQELRDQTII